MANWKWMLIGLAMATIFIMWFDGTIETVRGYGLIAATYLAMYAASREVKGKPRPVRVTRD